MTDHVHGSHASVARTELVNRFFLKKCKCCTGEEPSRSESTIPEPLNIFDARTSPERKVPDADDMDEVPPFDTKIDWTEVPCMSDLERGVWDIHPERDGSIRIRGRRPIPLEKVKQLPKEVWDKYDNVLTRCANGFGFGPVSDEIWNVLHPKDPLEVGSPPRRDKDKFYKRWLEGHDFY